MHPLDNWLESQGKTREWLAEAAVTSTPTLSRIITGKQWPSRELTRRLMEITGLSADAILGDQAPGRQSIAPEADAGGDEGSKVEENQ